MSPASRRRWSHSRTNRVFPAPPTQHFVMLQRNLLHTAVTRARKPVVLVGSRKALGIAVRNADVALSRSRLDVRLRTARG